tara:strand:- start:3635 stop:5566 length:1932 start_codon:yes stop_codon:yes gene_type:complete
MFRLQRFFSGSSLVFILISAVSLGLFYRYLSIDLLLNEGENKNVTTTRILANSLWPQMERLLAEEHPVGASDASRQLDEQVKQLIEGLQVVKIKLYRPSGMTVFSTDLAQVGQDQSGNPAIVLARQGELSNSFVERDHFNSFDQRYEQRDLLQTYLPLYRPDSDQVVGVFEVYTDYTPLLTRLAQAQGVVVAGIGVILLLLYAALLLLVRHAEVVIRRQDIQLRDSVRELVATQASLEQRVAERTQTLQQSNRNLEIEVQQRELMEQIISDREQRLQAVMDNLLNAIIVCDEQGAIELINPSAEKLFGYSSREVAGQYLLSLFATPITCTAETRSATLEHWLAPLLEAPAERQSQRRNASRFPAEVAVTRFQHGAQARYIVSFRDLSAQVLAEKALGESRQKLLHQEKMAAIGSLSSGIVHEIGNPIAAIDGLLQAICGDSAGGPELPPEIKADLELIQQQVQRLISINRDVSEFSSPRDEVATLLDFNTLVGRTCSLMRYDGRMKEVKLRLDLDPKLPAMKLFGDQLIQVLMNLISNAVDAVNEARKDGVRTDVGEIWVRTRLVGQQLILSVQDNGTGMDQETTQQAVDAFFTTKAPGMGTGLGLSICDSIIAHHGGEIEIESALGRGTYVQVLLPVVEMDD